MFRQAQHKPIIALVERKELQVLDIQPEDREYGASLPGKCFDRLNTSWAWEKRKGYHSVAAWAWSS
jgi:hypothetical protein